jgi:tetratricopeptide (TPR) repeat protein
MRGDTAAARAAFERALARNPDVARAHSALAFLDAQSGAPAASLEHFRRALALDARECEPLLALASIAGRRGGAPAARPYLELFAAWAGRTPCRAAEPRVRAWLEGGAPR